MGPKLLLFTMLIGMSSAYTYYFQAMTADKAWASTPGPVYVEFFGTYGRTYNFGDINDMDTDSEKLFTRASSTYIGSIQCISIKMGTSNAWMPETLVAWASYDVSKKAYFYSRYQWYSTNTGEGIPTKKFCKQGDTTYAVTATTSNRWYAGSDNIWASVTITGSTGTTETGVLDNKMYNDFKGGSTDRFVFPGMKDVGCIKCITVTVRGTDGWLFTSITVQKIGPYTTPVTFKNTNSVWLDADSTRQLKLCNKSYKKK